MSGFFEIGIYNPKTKMNVGTLWRSAYQLGASGIFIIGPRGRDLLLRQSSDTYKTPENIPLRYYEYFDDWLAAQPFGAQIVAVEFPGVALSQFVHPRKAVYILGAEDAGLPEGIRNKCQHIVQVEAVRQPSYNVAVAGSIVMWHRLSSRIIPDSSMDRAVDF